MQVSSRDEFEVQWCYTTCGVVYSLAEDVKASLVRSTSLCLEIYGIFICSDAFFAGVKDVET